MGRRGPGTYGRCPDCGRIVAGRADGIQRKTADKQWVLLGAHSRKAGGGGGQCLTRGARRRVPSIGRQKEAAAVP